MWGKGGGVGGKGISEWIDSKFIKLIYKYLTQYFKNILSIFQTAMVIPRIKRLPYL